MKPTSKRKSRPQQNEMMGEGEAASQKSKTKYLDENKRVREEFTFMESQVAELNNYKTLVLQLHQEGIIDQEGNPFSKAREANPAQQFLI